MADIFISHIGDEAPVADALKAYLMRCFGPSLQVFVSSDYDSIATGEEWYRAIVRGIRAASVVVVLLSRYSIDRRWINFESGLALGANVRMLPLTIRGFHPGDVGLPLSQFHARTLSDALAVEGVIHAIADATGSTILRIEASDFIEQLMRIEANLPVKSITLEPLLYGAGGDRLLRFRLSNTGNRDVELIEVEVRVPTSILRNWSPPTIPNVISAERCMQEGTEQLIIWEQPFDGAIDRKWYGVHTTLPRIISPHWTARLSDLLRIPIREDIEMPERQFIQHKVVARESYAEGRKSLADIPVLQ